jgi:hypothetical protein
VLKLLFVLLLLQSTPAYASLVLSAEGCIAYASWSGDIVWAKSVGADKAKVKASLTGAQNETKHPLFVLLQRDFERLWTTQVEYPKVTTAVLTDCYNRRGIYGSEV